jgi:predicted alpha/beta superfamily hydrolase
MLQPVRSYSRFVAPAALCLAAAPLSSCDEATLPAPAGVSDTIPLDHLPALRGDYFELASQAAGRSFHVYVRLPQNYDAEVSANYPVVYVLDGDSLFPVLAAQHLFLNIDESLPEALIVGIAYGSFDPASNKRGFDFSAPAADARPEQGGAPAFHEFLKSELLPTIESRYRADAAKRVLFGQSRGGYMVLYSAFTDPDLFWGRIASNAALTPGRERFFSPAAPASRTDLGLVVTSGSRDYPELRANALEWFAAWEHADEKPWAVKAVTIEGGTHAADSPSSYRAGMQWLFNRGN